MMINGQMQRLRPLDDDIKHGWYAVFANKTYEIELKEKRLVRGMRVYHTKVPYQ